MTYKLQPQFRLAPLSFVIAAALSSSHTVFAEPSFKSGNADVTAVGKDTIVNVTASEYETLQWDSFNLDRDESVTFNQLSTNSVVVNQIAQTSASKVFGTINANGHVYLVNTNGFVFNNSTNINTAGFLASTFTTTLNGSDDQLTISGDSTGNIDIQGFNTGESNQYIAFYSPNMTFDTDTEDSEINLGQGNAYFHTASGLQSGTIQIAGLPTGFAIDSSALTNTQENITINNGTKVELTGENSKIIINQNSLNTILSSAVRIPETFKASDIILASNEDIRLETSQNFNGSTISRFELQTAGNIVIENNIFGSDLSLILSSGVGATNNISEVSVSYDDQANYIPSRLGGSGGLDKLVINTNTLTDSKSINTNELYINGNLNINTSDGQFSINALDQLTIEGNIGFSGLSTPDNVTLRSQNMTLHGISTGSEAIDYLTIFTDNLNISGNYGTITNFNLTKNTLNGENEIGVTLGGDLTILGDNINLNNSHFSSENNSSYNLIFGNTDNTYKSLSLNKVSSETGFKFKSLVFYLDDQSSGLNIGGSLSSSNFNVNVNSAGIAKITLGSDFELSGIKQFSTKNTSISSEFYGLSLFAQSGLSSTAEIYNIDTNSLTTTGFTSTYLFGTDYIMESGSFSIDSDSIEYQSDSAINITTTSGSVYLSSLFDAANQDVNINTTSGSISLNGIDSAKNILINSGNINGNGSHQLEGEYIAPSSIRISRLENITNIGGITFESPSLDIQSSGLKSEGTIDINADTSEIGELNGKNIFMDHYSDGSSTTSNLHGNITASEDLDFNIDSIYVVDDISLSGNINLFDRKAYDGATLKYQNQDDSFGSSVSQFNGTENVTFKLSNPSIYLYDMGSLEALASLTISSPSDDHNGTLNFIIDAEDNMVVPNIAGTQGLSILGDWTWTMPSGVTYNTDNYNLDLSGVTIKTDGTAAFDTGSGDLSLGEINASDLIIGDTNNLSIHGDWNLSKPENAYNFANVSSVTLFKDLIIGSEETPLNVDLTDTFIDGTYSLTIYSDQISLGTIGDNIALQNLSIYTGSDLTLTNDINLVGSIDISAANLTLNSDLRTTGLDININTLADITMSADSSLITENGSMSLVSETGNIDLAQLYAGESIWIESKVGSIKNIIDDYISDDSTSINITTSELTLLGKLGIGESVASPIVIDYKGTGAINAESDGNIYIANLADAPTNSSSRVFDSSSSNDIAIIDAYNQLQLSSLNAYIEPQYETTLGLIDHFSWQTVGEEKIKKIQRPSSTPNLYYGRDGWRLGYFGK
ncbi:filamentous hemagglutinin N-terminal domain-containing protein [Bermanella marisrubri]|uniref:Probable adhesin n=1 Tax=Bermanella marisrubri TaxID=207949 RepID=Q1N530_9GAMM|nr:filamentous hemagglutinin N-terminal domain-containing protein [Bermanella marisrubri]EAT13248.1 probable adhesin [Oceanobacter sp. RED65] [Bermanella marisrubri]QIZ84016.1 filamentous hemagglutinin N-terminal domain-containing protein [Bermanella marisrubri]